MSSQTKTNGQALAIALQSTVPATIFDFAPMDDFDALAATNNHAARVVPIGLEPKAASKCRDHKNTYAVFLYTAATGAAGAKTVDDHAVMVEAVITALGNIAINDSKPSTLTTAEFMDWDALKRAQVCITTLQVSY